MAQLEENIDPEDHYFNMLRSYYADKGGDVEQLLQMIQAGDRAARQSLEGEPPIHTVVSDSGKTVIRWVEDAHQVNFLGMVSENGKIPREDRAFAKEQRQALEDKVAAGRTLQASFNEFSRPFLEGMVKRLNRREPPVTVELASGGKHDVAGFGEWENITITHALQRTEPAAAEALAQFKARAEELHLTDPALPFASMAINGKPFVRGRRNGTNNKPAGTFTDLTEDPEKCLEVIGTYTRSEGVLSWVNEKGEHRVARAVRSNLAAIQDAGYQPSTHSNPLSSCNFADEADWKSWETILNTPENENDRLLIGVRNVNPDMVAEAIRNGADVAQCKDYNNPVILTTFDHIVNYGARDEIIRHLLPVSPLKDDNDYTMLHAAMAHVGSDINKVLPDILAAVDPFALTKSGVPAFLAIRIEHGSQPMQDAFNTVMDAMERSPDLTMEERRALVVQRAFLNKYLDADIAEHPLRQQNYEEILEARKTGDSEAMKRLEIRSGQFHAHTDLSRAFMGLASLWKNADQVAEIAPEQPGRHHKIPPRVTAIIDGLIRKRGTNAVIGDAEAADLLEPVMHLKLEGNSDVLLHQSIRSDHPTDDILQVVLDLGADPFARDYGGIPGFLFVDPVKDMGAAKKELGMLINAIARSPERTPEEKEVMLAQRDLISHHLDKVAQERLQNREVTLQIKEAEENLDYTLARELKANVPDDAEKKLGAVMDGLRQVWHHGVKNQRSNPQADAPVIPAEVTKILGAIIAVRSGENPAGLTEEQRATLLEPVSVLNHNHQSNDLLSRAVISYRPAEDMIKALLTLGYDPFAPNDNGVPPFLSINIDKNPAQIQKELDIMIGAMRAAPDTTAHDQMLVTAQYELMSHLLERAGAEITANAGKPDGEKTFHAAKALRSSVEGLRALWRDSGRFPTGENPDRTPAEVSVVLSELLDIQAKINPDPTPERKARFLEPIAALAGIGSSSEPLFIAALRSDADASLILPCLMKYSDGPFAVDAENNPAFVCINPDKKSARSELGFVVAQMRKNPGMDENDKKLLTAQSNAIIETWKERDAKRAANHDADPKAAPPDYERKPKEFLKGLGKVWQENPGDAAHPLAPALHALLAPLLSNKEMPAFISFMAKYDGSTTADMVREVTTHVALPQALKIYARETGIDLANDEALKALDGKSSTLINELMPAVEERLLGSRNLLEREALSVGWHRNNFPDKLVPYKGAGSWHPLMSHKAFVIDPAGKTNKTIEGLDAKGKESILVLPGADTVRLEHIAGQGTQMTVGRSEPPASFHVLVKGAQLEEVEKRLEFVKEEPYPTLTGTTADPRLITLTEQEINERRDEPLSPGGHKQKQPKPSPHIHARPVPLRMIDVPESALRPDGSDEKKSGVYVMVETNSDRLKYLSRPDVMDHCVGRGGNYSSQCLNPTGASTTHIISVCEEGKDTPLTTIEAEWNIYEKKFVVHQNKGLKNSSAYEGASAVPDNLPDTEENRILSKGKNAELWLKNQLESGTIDVTDRFGETDISKRINSRSEISKTVGFDLREKPVGGEKTTPAQDAYAEYTGNLKRKAARWDPETQKWFDRSVTSQSELFQGLTVPVLDEEGKPVLKMVKLPVKNEAGELVYMLDAAGNPELDPKNGKKKVKTVEQPETDGAGNPVMKTRSHLPSTPEEWFALTGMETVARPIMLPHAYEHSSFDLSKAVDEGKPENHAPETPARKTEQEPQKPAGWRRFLSWDANKNETSYRKRVSARPQPAGNEEGAGSGRY